jgi:hypothetical protein
MARTVTGYNTGVGNSAGVAGFGRFMPTNPAQVAFNEGESRIHYQDFTTKDHFSTIFRDVTPA